MFTGGNRAFDPWPNERWTPRESTHMARAFLMFGTPMVGEHKSEIQIADRVRRRENND